MLTEFCTFENILSQLEAFWISALFHSCLHSRPHFWTSTFNFPAFCLFGIDSCFSSKAIGGLSGVEGGMSTFSRKNPGFWKENKITLWNVSVPICSDSMILCVSFTVALLSWVPCGSSVLVTAASGSLFHPSDLDTMQVNAQLRLLLVLFLFFAFESPELHGSQYNLSLALLQLLLLGSPNFVLKFDYFVTQAYYDVDIAFGCAVQSCKPICCLEAVSWVGGKVYL